MKTPQKTHGPEASWLMTALVAFLLLAPEIRSQAPPPGVLIGSTTSASLRNAYAATRDQAGVVGRTANAWGRNAASRNYRLDVFQSDFRTMELQFQALRQRFDWMVALAQQINRPQSRNVLAELDAGLNIIAELLVFVDQQFNAGTLDAATLTRTCRTFEDVMGQWEAELRRKSAYVSW